MKKIFFIIFLFNTILFPQIKYFSEFNEEILNLRFFNLDEDIFFRNDSSVISNLAVNKNNPSIDNYLLSKFNNRYKVDSGMTFLNLNTLDNFYILKYSNSRFYIQADPVLGFSYYSSNNSQNILHSFNGLAFNGRYGENLYFDAIFYDNHEKDNPLKSRKFTRETGIHVVVNNGDYGEVRGNLKLVYDWGAVSLGKDFINIGSGYDGKVILSSKAPSFPYFGYNIKPASWLTFTYLHGWLKSGVIDSSSIRRSSTGANVNSFNYTYNDISKYIALHYLTLNFEDLKFSIGESIIYSGYLKYEYFIPVLFYRFVDHYNTNASSGNNAQMFADINYVSKPLSTNFYFSLYLDEIEITKLIKGEPGNNQTAYTIGFNSKDPLWSNSNIIFEYTKIMPFVYLNFNSAETFASSGYQLGHWIGSNADEIYLSLKQFLYNKVYCSLWGELIRKGQQETTTQEYTFVRPPFLFGSKSYFYNIGSEIMYEPVNKLKVYLTYVHNIKSTGRFIKEFNLIEKNYFNFSLSFGL